MFICQELIPPIPPEKQTDIYAIRVDIILFIVIKPFKN